MELPELPDFIILEDAGYAISHYLLTSLANSIKKQRDRIINPKLIHGMWWNGHLEFGKDCLFCFLEFV